MFNRWIESLRAGLDRWQSKRGVSKRRRPGGKQSLKFVAAEHLEVRQLLSNINIVFDYTYDTNGFFNTAAKQALLTQAASAFTSHFSDNLAAITPSGTNTWTATFINPSTGASQSISNLSIANGTIIIYVGGRANSGSVVSGGFGGWSGSGDNAWLDTLQARGQSGALLVTPTDFGPWGGFITFDTGTNWFFGSTTAGITAKQVDFVTAATMEIAQVLGFGSAPSFFAQSSGGKFTGATAAAVSDQGINPTLASDGSHWAQGTTSYGVSTLIEPTLPTGIRLGMTGLDYAAMRDVGWTLNPVSVNGSTVDVFGTAGNDAITIAAGTSYTVTINGTAYTFNPAGITAINVHGLAGNDTISAATSAIIVNTYGDGGNDTLTAGLASDKLYGGAGDDTLNAGPGTNTLYGGFGNDHYVFAAASAATTTTVVELTGQGTDTLDFSAITVAVTANLTSDTSLAKYTNETVKTGATGEAAFFENVIGGTGGNTLTGNAANNVLISRGGTTTITAGSARSILVGGSGAATLTTSGSVDDLLIGGSTDFDTNVPALLAIMNEWKRTDKTYSQRVSDLRGTTTGGLNGSYDLNSTTVHLHSGGTDTLTGNKGSDWFWAASSDVIKNKVNAEIVN